MSALRVATLAAALALLISGCQLEQKWPLVSLTLRGDIDASFELL